MNKCLAKKTTSTISVIIVASMLLTLVACKGKTERTNAITTGSNEIREESIEAGETAETTISEFSSTETTTSAPSGMYTYTIYGDIQLSMDINVDDYIFTNNSGEQCFRIAQLAYDCGWMGEDQYTEIDNSVSASYNPNYYTFHSGDIVAHFVIGHCSDEFVPGTENSQFNYISLTYGNSNYGGDSIFGDNSYYTYEDLCANPSHRSLECVFEKHYEDCNYRLIGEGWWLSREDIIVLSYILWATSRNPSNNPLVEAVGLDSDYALDYNDYVEYDLP